MTCVRKRVAASVAVLTAAVLFVTLGVPLSSADEPKTPAPPPAPRLDPPSFPRLFPGGGAFGSADMQKAQDQLFRAMEALGKDPNNAEARKQMAEAQQALMKALGGGFAMPDMNIPHAGIGRASKRARLGVRLAPVAPIVTDQLGLEPGKGVAIVDVLNGSAAEKAGFKVYDIVMEFAGKPVTGPADFAHQVNAAKAGEKVDAVVMRKGKRVELKGVELPALPRDPMGLPMNPKATDNAQPGAADSVSVSVSNGMFTIKAMQDGVSYLITGQAGADGAAVEKVSIKTGNDSVEANGVAKVPQKYRPTVEKLLKLVGKPRTKVID